MPLPSPGDWPRHCSRTARASLGASSPAPLRVFRFADCSVLDENSLVPLGHLRRVIGLRIGRESAIAHVGAIFPHRIRDDFTDIAILPPKFRPLVKRKTQAIVTHQYL